MAKAREDHVQLISRIEVRASTSPEGGGKDMSTTSSAETPWEIASFTQAIESMKSRGLRMLRRRSLKRKGGCAGLAGMEVDEVVCGLPDRPFIVAVKLERCDCNVPGCHHLWSLMVEIRFRFDLEAWERTNQDASFALLTLGPIMSHARDLSAWCYWLRAENDAYVLTLQTPYQADSGDGAVSELTRFLDILWSEIGELLETGSLLSEPIVSTEFVALEARRLSPVLVSI